MAINEKMYDLGIELLDDGNINLEQDAGYGEMSRITLHPSQLRLIAERTGLLDSVPPTWPRGFKRRLERLRERADDLGKMLYSIPSLPPGSGLSEDVIAALALLDNFDDMFADYLDDDAKSEPINNQDGNVSAQIAKPAQTELPEQLTLS